MKVYQYLNNRITIHEEGKYPLILSEADTESLLAFALKVLDDRLAVSQKTLQENAPPPDCF